MSAINHNVNNLEYKPESPYNNVRKLVQEDFNLRCVTVCSTESFYS